MGFSGNDPVVAEVAGHNVTYSQYIKEYEQIQRQSGVQQMDEQQEQMIYNATWQNIVMRYMLLPGFAKMGLDVTEQERLAIVRGEIPTQAMMSAFGNPQTGMYDINALNSFLVSSQGNPEAESMWAMLNEQACEEREITKYAMLVNGGVNINQLEAAQALQSANKRYAGRWAGKRYSTIADSLVTISNSEIKSYYDANKEQYKRQPTRTLSYVNFAIEPSESDKAALQAQAEEQSNHFNKVDGLREYVRESRNGSIADNYITLDQMDDDEAAAIGKGGKYGPESNATRWRISRAIDVKSAPDTLSIRHIVLPYTDDKLADSLLIALRKPGAEFQEVARQYSVYSQSAQNGGEIGAMPFSAFTVEFVDKLATAKKGDIVKINVGDMIQLIQVYDAGKVVRQYKLASVEIPIVASQKTLTDIHGKAGILALAVTGSNSSLADAAEEADVMVRSADLTSASRNINGVSGSSQVARWAHRAEVGDVSEIFKVDGGYVVALLTAINDSAYSSMDDVKMTIERELRNAKKYEMIVSELSGTSYEERAASMNGESGEFSDIYFDSFYINGLGVEPRVIGAISAASESGVTSQYIEGNNGVYIVEVSSITDIESPQTQEEAAERALSMSQNISQQMLFGALESLSDIEDLRGQSL